MRRRPLVVNASICTDHLVARTGAGDLLVEASLTRDGWHVRLRLVAKCEFRFDPLEQILKETLVSATVGRMCRPSVLIGRNSHHRNVQCLKRRHHFCDLIRKTSVGKEQDAQAVLVTLPPLLKHLFRNDGIEIVFVPTAPAGTYEQLDNLESPPGQLANAIPQLSRQADEADRCHGFRLSAPRR
jgi:hypothetical protein